MPKYDKADIERRMNGAVESLKPEGEIFCGVGLVDLLRRQDRIGIHCIIRRDGSERSRCGGCVRQRASENEPDCGHAFQPGSYCGREMRRVCASSTTRQIAEVMPRNHQLPGIRL